MLLFVDSPPFLLTHNPADACMYASWRGPHTGEATRRDYEQLLRYVRVTQSAKLLHDALLDKNGSRKWSTGWQ